VVAVTCTLGLMMQCALLLYSAFRPSNSSLNIVLAVMLVLLCEAVPGGVLVITIRQPKSGAGRFLAELLWCFQGNASSGSGMSSTKGNRSRPRGSSTSTAGSHDSTADGSGDRAGSARRGSVADGGSIPISS
jgi:hypothetical protein